MALTIVEALLLLGALVLAIFDGAVLYEKGVKY